VDRAAILNEWLAQLGQLNPASDPFRDPVGHTLREVLPVLAEVALGERPVKEAIAPLERLMRIRAVQDIAPSQAVGFLLRPNAALALMAFDMYVRCLEDLHTVQIRELRRRARS
jgi:hypothetical protein